MKRNAVFVLALLSVVLIGFSSNATEIVPVTLENMTDVSDAIVVGDVQDQFCYWENGKIYTNVIIEIDQSLKSSTSDGDHGYVELKLLGGQVGDTRLEIEHAPVFVNNEKVMLFLRKMDSGYIPVGFFYGVYKVTRDEQTQKDVIRGPLFDPQYSMVYDRRTMRKVMNTEQTGPRDFDDFVQEVNGLIRSGQ
jgi:hypothetical protein